VFEGYGTNTAEAAWRTAKRFGLTIPIGHDGSDGVRSVMMGRYRTGGTPWSVIIDKEGVVRFNDFFIEVDDAEKLINELRLEGGGIKGKNEDAKKEVKIKTLARARGGQDVIGMMMPGLVFDRWFGVTEKLGKPAKGEVVLYRWWTDSCPYCESSLPAFEALRKKYEKKGLKVVAVYHPKPVRVVEGEQIVKRAAEWGYRGLIAEDRDWSVLRDVYLDLQPRRATSVSFLVDEKGVIRFVHPGPVLFASSKEGDEQVNSDYAMLDDAIGVLVGGDGE